MIMANSEFNQIKYMNEYKKEHYKRIEIVVPQSDTEMIEWLNEHKPYSTYFIELAKKDMKNHKKHKK